MSAPAKPRVRIEISHDLCAGIQMCVQLAPDAFTLSESGQAVYVPGSDTEEELIREAAESCPMSAIRIVDAAD